MFHYTVETNKSIDDAISSLEENLSTEKFGILWSFNVKDKLEEKGLDFKQDYRILEVCNPFEAEKVLSKNQMVGYFLPCKIVVYDDQGTTKIGMPKPTELINILEDDSLNELALEIENRLIGCIDKSV